MPSAKYCYHSPLGQNEEYTIANAIERRDDYGVGIKLQSRYQRFWLKHWAWFTHGALFCLSTILLVLVIQAQSQAITFPDIYSPANVAVEYNKELTTFNGTFDFGSIYRGEHSPELDAAWDRISQDKLLNRVTLEQLLKIGKTNLTSKVKLLEEDGGGYMVSLEVFHLLHCLNTIRKYTYLDYYGTVDTALADASPLVFKTHPEHCIEMIRQQLMCTADVGMITYEWVRDFSEPYPDFNTKHQCRNFEKILAWANENALHVPRDHVLRFEDEVDLADRP